MPDLAHDTLRRLLRYEPETGSFFWIVRRQGICVGAEAGNIRRNKSNGRMECKIEVCGKVYIRSRLAWFWITGEWPRHKIDHRDLNPVNDRWDNLREATTSQNGANTAKRRGCAVPLKGVCKNKNRYQAQIKVDGKSTYLGLFDTAEQAHAAYARAASEIYGEFARTS